jgi:hypothetical protein
MAASPPKAALNHANRQQQTQMSTRPGGCFRSPPCDAEHQVLDEKLQAAATDNRKGMLGVELTG